MLNGILWILRTGAPWRDLPEGYGPWQTVYSRFYRWRKAGVWDRLWERLLQQADQDELIDWECHHVDGTIVRAHKHAAGAKGGLLKPKPWVAAGEALVPKSTSVSRAEDIPSRSC
jgi:transposase